MPAAKERRWPRKDIRYLRKHYHEVPVQTLADRFNKTRSAVIGMARRLGLAVPREETNLRMVAGKAASAALPRPRQTASPIQQPSPPPPRPLPRRSSGGVSIIDHVEGQCRFPLGQRKVSIIDVKHDLAVFCGNPVDNGGVYCPEHRALAFDRVRTRSANTAAANYRTARPF